MNWTKVQRDAWDDRRYGLDLSAELEQGRVLVIEDNSIYRPVWEDEDWKLRLLTRSERGDLGF